MRCFVAWSAALAAAALWEWSCTHTDYDLRRSVDGCLNLKDSAACEQLQPGCVAPATVLTASPRWLARLAGDGGPLLTWLPLYAASEQETLPLVLMWYLGLVGPVRHTHRVLRSRWDPSGHVFVYGAQLVPLWLGAWPRAAFPGAWLRCWSVVLCYLSAMTAAFFHTPSETGAGWLLVAALWAALHGTRPPPTWLPAASLATWAGFTAYAWFDASAGERSILVGQLVYDAVLWALLLLPRLRRQGVPASEAELRQLGRAAGDSSGEMASALRRRERSPPES
jgi:hypothetical protein